MWKNVSKVLICGLTISTLGSSICEASTLHSDTIPKSAEANALIEYEGNSKWQEIDSDTGLSQSLEDAEDVSALTRFGLFDFDLTANVAEATESEGAVYTALLPEPQEGMLVQYDNWGEVETVYVLEDGEYAVVSETFIEVSSEDDSNAGISLLSSSTALAKGTRAAVGTYTYGSVESKTTSKVGYTTNTIKITSSKVVGTGDFTVYTDTIGDHDNTLKKGDCATKKTLDNPKSDQEITVTNMLNGTSSTFTKNDVGTLDNAVIDIWKTGVTKLGVTSTNYANIKKAVKYKYEY